MLLVGVPLPLLAVVVPTCSESEGERGKTGGDDEGDDEVTRKLGVDGTELDIGDRGESPCVC